MWKMSKTSICFVLMAIMAAGNILPSKASEPNIKTDVSKLGSLERGAVLHYELSAVGPNFCDGLKAALLAGLNRDMADRLAAHNAHIARLRADAHARWATHRNDDTLQADLAAINAFAAQWVLDEVDYYNEALAAINAIVAACRLLHEYVASQD